MSFADAEWEDLPKSTGRERGSRKEEKATFITVAEGTVIGDSRQLELQAESSPISIARGYGSDPQIDMGHPYEYHDPKLNRPLKRKQFAPTAFPPVETGSSTSTGRTESLRSSFTATFDARTMNEVAIKCPKRLSKEKSKAVWANRNETCEKHKKQKKWV